MNERALIVGDVGPKNGIFHVGDEAMTERAITELRARGWQQITVVSANPHDTSQRYGVDSVASEVVPATIDDVLRDVDLLLVAGGGNLNDMWPEHITLRLALCEPAAARGVDVVVTGQGLGPFRTESSAEGVRRILATARVIGVRDAQSHALCMEWGIPADRVFLNVDDAYGRIDGEIAAREQMSVDMPELPNEYAVASFSAWHGGMLTQDEYLDVCVSLVEDLHAVTGQTVLLIPQEGSLKGERVDDVLLHDHIKNRVGKGVALSLPVQDSATSRRLIRDSKLVVSSRFHPVIFALAESIPSLGVVVDEYTHSKLSQALADQGEWGVTLAAPLARPSDTRAAIEILWVHRDEVRAHLDASFAATHLGQDAWWDVVAGSTSTSGIDRVRRASDERLSRYATDSPSTDPVMSRLAEDSVTLARISGRIWQTEFESREYIASLEHHLADATERLADATEYARSLEAEITKQSSLRKRDE